jgi:hypothetical protein
MYKHLSFIYLHESLPESLHYLSRARVITECEQTVRLVEGRLVAVAHLEPLLVPPDHSQSLLQLLHVTRDIRYLHLRASHYQTTCKVDSFLGVGLLDELVVSV